MASVRENGGTLDQRVERLERMVADLQRALHGQSGAGAPPSAASPARVEAVSAAGPRPAKAERGEPAAAWRVRMWDSEMWLNKLGVALVLFGVTFLFKYSIEQGWLTPAVRVGFGLLVGATMLAAGLRLPERQRSLARVLAGGGIAVFYIAGFAAFQLYSLVGYGTAFAFMVAVTGAAFFLALREDAPVLSLIGVKGALGTPFLLYGSRGDFTWLVAYTCLVVAAAIALFVRRGWRSVLWTAFAGGWAVLGIAWYTDVASTPVAWSGDRVLLQAAAIAVWAMFALVPPAWEARRGMLRHADGAPNGPGTAIPAPLRAHLFLLAALTALAGVGSVALASPLGVRSWGWLAIAAAVGYCAVAAKLYRARPELAAAHLMAAALLLPIGATAALSGERLLLVLAAEAAALHLLAHRARVPGAARLAHLLFAVVAAWTVFRLQAWGIAGTPRALADLATAALALAAAGWLAAPRERVFYRLAVHAALLAWLWRELAPLAGGAAYVSVAWSTYAVALLSAGLWLRLDLVQRTGLATLLVVVAKLFVVDLAALDAIWRIVLFLGIGAGFLLISFLLQGLWEQRARIAGR
jgi:uncharacterized membrane protein